MRGLLILLLFLCANVCYAQVKEPINRTWTSIAGTEVEAELVSFTDREVVLKLKQGKTIKLPLSKLAKYDRYFVKGLEKSTVPEGGVKYNQLDDNSWDIIQGKKGNKELLHYLNKKRFSGVAYKMQPKPNRDLFTKPGDEGYYTDMVSEVITFKSGLPNGLYKNFNGNGQKVWEVKKRVKSIQLITDGLSIRWDKSGKEITEATFVDNKKNGLETKWHSNGQKEQERNYKDGKADGLVVGWHENGQKKGEVNYKDGEEVEGSRKYWNSKGEPVDTYEESIK
ncbi:SHD1 domain-containing protein [Verrucomicrobia bacterium]|nr:SHD1 domain-containing protein [Verrucomicrobiota bacterium]|tara:strand:- start:66 stop:908 length:843 start_codon:yes stop_codon:yes gene_type:complete